MFHINKFGTHYMAADEGLFSLVQKTDSYLFRKKSLPTMSLPNGTSFGNDNRLEVSSQFLNAKRF